jgi:hypothetical protein
MGWFLRNASDDAFTALLGVAGLVMCVGFGLLGASKVIERSRRDSDNSSHD